MITSLFMYWNVSFLMCPRQQLWMQRDLQPHVEGKDTAWALWLNVMKWSNPKSETALSLTLHISLAVNPKWYAIHYLYYPSISDLCVYYLLFCWHWNWMENKFFVCWFAWTTCLQNIIHFLLIIFFAKTDVMLSIWCVLPTAR